MTEPGSPIDDRLIKMIRKLRAVPPRDEVTATNGRAKFLSEAAILRSTVSNLHDQRHNGWFNSIKNHISISLKEKPFMFTVIVSALVALVLFFSGASATAFAAQGTLPGDTLYPIKAATEQFQLSLSSDAGDVALYQTFAQRRVDEIAALVAAGRFDDIQLATSRYRNQLQKAVFTLDRIEGKDMARASALSMALQGTFSAQAALLNKIRLGAPMQARLTIEEAIRESQPGVRFEFVGTVGSINPEFWDVAGRTVSITPDTEIEEDIAVGDLVKVRVLVGSDGSLTAHEIELFEAGDEFTFVGEVQTIGENSWTIGGQTVMVFSSTQIEANIIVGDLVRVHTLVDADGTLNATKIELLDKAGGHEFEITGIVEAIAADSIVVSGKTILITSLTEIKDNFAVNDFVKVEGVITIDGTLVAREIGLADDVNGNENENENENDENSNDNGNINGDDDHNGNDNDENDNDNGNINGDDDHNGNDNDENDNDNGNINGDDDHNGNDNDENDNDNGNINGDDDDENGNDNSNINGDDDHNGNGNGGDDQNENDDDHHNDNDDSGNGNGNDNGNENGDDSFSPLAALLSRLLM